MTDLDLYNDINIYTDFFHNCINSENRELTVDKLKELQPGIFASGIGLITHPWFNNATNLESDGRSTKVKWVAVRGDINDWCIYHSMDANLCKDDYFDGINHMLTFSGNVAKHGAKLKDKEIIRKLVPCTDGAFKLYRF